MRKILAETIASGKAMPIKSGTLGFLQYAYGEMFAELLQELYPNLAINDYPVGVRGATWANAGGTYTMQPGTIFVGGNAGASSGTNIYPYGEIFLLPEIQTLTPIDHPILVVGTTYFTATNADPVKFTDGNNYNVHAIRTLTLADGDNTTPNFVCYIDNTNPNDASPLLIYADRGFSVKKSGILADFVLNDTVQTIFTLTPAFPFSSSNLTIRISGEGYFVTPTNDDLTTLNLVVNGTIVKTTYIPGAVVLQPFILEWIVSNYVAGQSIVVSAVTSSVSDANEIRNMILIAECLDAS